MFPPDRVPALDEAEDGVVSNFKPGRIFLVFLKDLEEAAPADSQDAQDVINLDFLVHIPFQKSYDLRKNL
jgi:hypothetical protein